MVVVRVRGNESLSGRPHLEGRERRWSLAEGMQRLRATKDTREPTLTYDNESQQATASEELYMGIGHWIESMITL